MTISYSALSDRLKDGALMFTGWCMLPSHQVAELVARGPFDAVLVDMQHGGVGFNVAQDMVGAIALVGNVPLVRIPVGDFATASRALDFGAQAIIAPMINDASDAQALVNAVKYPPIGERSFGPFRACQLYGVQDANDYVKDGNRSCLAFAMIETQRALDNLDAILSVDGIDGIFVGPADMSLTLLGGERFDLENEEANHLYKMVADKARAAGKYTAIYAPNVTYARRFADYGYQLISVGSDAGYLADGMAGNLEQLADLRR